MSEQENEAIAWWRPYLWPGVVVTLLAGHVFLIVGSLVLSASMMPGVSVAPAGYAEALAWDEQKAARLESERLGWTLVVEPGARYDLMRGREVTFQLLDRDGAPIEGADLYVTMFHHARPASVIEQKIAPSDDAPTYVANLPMARPGQWRLSVLATHSGSRFVSQSDFWLNEDGGDAS